MKWEYLQPLFGLIRGSLPWQALCMTITNMHIDHKLLQRKGLFHVILHDQIHL